jgi:alpha-glucoside transport system substrate-binding protein
MRTSHLYKFILILAAFLAFFSCKQEETTVSIIGTWGGSELESFEAVCAESGVDISFETTRDLDAILTTRTEAGNLPDMAILPNPSKLKELARANVLTPLGYLDEKSLEKDYARSWIDLGSYAGDLYGIFFKTANKSVIWYSPRQFAANGWQVPATWDELIALTDQIRTSGKTPWSIGADAGWPLTDWIENIMIRTGGPEVYQQWIDHDIAWTDPAVKNAFLTWGDIVVEPANLAGGIDGTMAATFQQGAYTLFKKTPDAYLYYEGDFIGDIVTSEIEGLEKGKDISFFAFPPIDEQWGTPVVGGADVVVTFNKKPSVTKLVKFLVTREAHSIWVKRGGFRSHNRSVSLDDYPDATMRASAEILANADIFVFDASDMMPPAVGNKGGFFDAAKKFLANPADIDAILQEMDEKARASY